jgi:hypothetical protein
MNIAWGDLKTAAGQLAALVALTGLTYRLLRMWWPDVPEVVVQFVAAIYSSATVLIVTYDPATPTHQWLTVGIFSGVLLSAQVVKLLDWSASAMTKTGATQAGIPEKPPAWWVAAQVSGTVTPEVTFKSTDHLVAQIKANEAAKATEVAKMKEDVVVAQPVAVPRERDA